MSSSSLRINVNSKLGELFKLSCVIVSLHTSITLSHCNGVVILFKQASGLLVHHVSSVYSLHYRDINKRKFILNLIVVLLLKSSILREIDSTVV